MADLGFPRGGGANPQGGGANLLFGKNFLKTAWKWKNSDPEGGRSSLAPPLKSANDVHTLFWIIWHYNIIYLSPHNFLWRNFDIMWRQLGQLSWISRILWTTKQRWANSGDKLSSNLWKLFWWAETIWFSYFIHSKCYFSDKLTLTNGQSFQTLKSFDKFIQLHKWSIL